MIDPVDGVTLPLPVTTDSPIRIRFSSPIRLYDVVLMQDLFGDWLVAESWYDRHTKRSGSKTRPTGGFDEGKTLLNAITRRRIQRGYQLVAA